MKSSKRFLILFVWVVFISGCQQPLMPSITPNAPFTQASSTEASPLATNTPEVYVTVLVVTQEQPTATPDFLYKNIENGILTEADIPNCELPCWLGLRIGESTKEDVQHVFNEAFFLNEPYDFFDESLWNGNSIIGRIDELEGLEMGGYEWAGDNRVLRYLAFVDVDTKVLQAIVVESSSFVTFWEPRTMQDIIQQLGTPDSIAGYRPKLPIEMEEIQFIYEAGLIFNISYKSQTILDAQGNVQTKQICLDARTSGYDVILEPFDISTIPNFIPNTPVAEYWGLYEKSYVSVEEAYGLTPEEFAAYAFEEEPCFEIDESLFESP